MIQIKYVVLAAFALGACAVGPQPVDAGTQPVAPAADAGTDAGLPPGTTVYPIVVDGIPEPDGGLAPIVVHAGTQAVYCTEVHLGNAEPIQVIGFQSQQAKGGHHIILVENDKDVPDGPPVQCGQSEAINPKNGSMIYISQIEQDSQLFPPGVGMTLPAHASLMLQLHYIDATPADLTLSSTVDVLAGPPGSITKVAAPMLFYDSGLQVTPGDSSAHAGCVPLSQQDEPVDVFMLAGHMHSHGIDFKLDFTDVDGGSSQIYETQQWDSPPEKYFAPPLLVQPGAEFDWSCSYFNADGGTITDPDEMCVTLGLYYPAPRGSMFCGAADGTNICGCIYGIPDGGVL